MDLNKQPITKTFTSYPLWLVIGLFFIIISPTFLTDGMFMDGLYYATISKNMSEQFGTFWAPEFTDTHSWGNGHPPLALYLQSLFYHFGNSVFIAKLYSLLTQICCGFIMYGIWKELGMKCRHFWFVLLLWMLIPLMFWASTNNLLENTMAIFTLLSVLFYLKSRKKHRFIFLCCTGLMVFLAFMTKGFTGIYPLAFPFIYWLCRCNISLKKMAMDSFTIVLVSAIPMAVLLLFYPPAKSFFVDYFSNQILNSIQNVQTVDSRFFIVIRFFKEIITPLVAVGIICLIALRQKVFKNSFSTIPQKTAAAFLLLTLCGVFPIMISLKQNGFYILTVFPIFAIGLGIFTESFLNNIRISEKIQIFFKITSVVVLLAAISANVFYAGKIGRDEKLLTDIYYLLPNIPEHTTIEVEESMSENYSAQAYLYFLKKISIVTKQEHEFFLCEGDHEPEGPYVLYKKAPNDFKLYRKVTE